MKKYLLLLLVAFGLFSCGDDDSTTGEVTFYLQPLFNGSEVLPNEVIQSTDGRNFSLKELRVYLTDLNLITNNDDRVSVSDLSLINWPTSNAITARVPIQQYKGVEFHVGLDAATNSLNPIDFEDSHPLSADQEMHWGMIKYRFISFVGYVDTSSAGNLQPENLIQYHLGRDSLYKAVEIARTFNKVGASDTYPLSFELNKMFDGPAGEIDIAVHRTNHSGEADMDKASIIMRNFVEALEED
mgnify:CR=1 FL=1